ncbi:MAG: N-acetyl-gamma-glutamyl-phosphate reductase [Candidatus Omnitrophota bacterium]
MLKVGIIGATGYTGEELIKILLRHPEVKITYLAAKVEKKSKISQVLPHFKGQLDLDCDNLDKDKAMQMCDLVFLALPHTVSMTIAPDFLKDGEKVIDLSADYRLDERTYEQWYKTKHTDAKGLKAAVYGLPELYREDVKKAKLIANPGCYPTAAILSLAPIVATLSKEIETIIIDAKSGVTGAGRKAALDFFFCEINENLKAYKLNSHQHMPEITQELYKLAKVKMTINFVPHLIPLNRGILETIYVKFSKPAEETKLQDIYKKFYKQEPFVRIKAPGSFPQIKDVAYTNYCDIGIKVVEKEKLAIIVAAIDNLLKGAAGQAVQNMNIMCGFKESTGLL